MRHRHAPRRDPQRLWGVWMTVLMIGVLAGCAGTRAPAAPEAAASAADDEVSVGYGTQERQNVTGAISTVSGEEVDVPVTRLEDLLVGRVAGVQVVHTPGGGVAVRIRGTTSLFGSSEPLYIVDGMPVQPAREGGLPGINPKDIARIEVLKDAGSTAIYGSRGANGVILITTKRGR